jgi:hypothetical protein
VSEATVDKFDRHLKRASATVATWPQWEQELLGYKKMNGNEPAFPSFNDRGYTELPGLTKREWMAAMCLQGLLANVNIVSQIDQLADHSDRGFEKIAADNARSMADAMLAELAKGGE